MPDPIPAAVVDPTPAVPVTPAAEPVADTQPAVVAAATETDNDLILKSFPDLIERDGDQFVFKPKPIQRDGQTIYPTTSGYRGKSAREVLEAINDGIVEKDATISRFKTDRLRAQTKIPEKPKVEPQIQQESPRQAYETLRSVVFRELIAETGVNPKYVEYKDEDWKALEGEIGAVQASRIASKVDSMLVTFQQRVDQRWNQSQITTANTKLAEDATEAVLDHVSENYPDMSEEEFARNWDAAFDDKSVFSADGRLRPEKLYQSFIRQAAKGKKTPLQQKLIEDKHVQKDIPAGMRTEGAGAAAAAAVAGGKPTGPAPMNMDDVRRNMAPQLQKT